MMQTALQPIGTLMIVDDCEFDQQLYRRIVDRTDVVGTLLQFTDPEQGLANLIDGTVPEPDLILLDINMPVMDGFEFLERATSSVRAEFCPVIFMLTTSLDPNDEARARSFDIVTDFLNKPLTSALLQQLADRMPNAA